jgi:hypothetical protein
LSNICRLRSNRFNGQHCSMNPNPAQPNRHGARRRITPPLYTTRPLDTEHRAPPTIPPRYHNPPHAPERRAPSSIPLPPISHQPQVPEHRAPSEIPLLAWWDRESPDSPTNVESSGVPRVLGRVSLGSCGIGVDLTYFVPHIVIIAKRTRRGWHDGTRSIQHQHRFL